MTASFGHSNRREKIALPAAIYITIMSPLPPRCDSMGSLHREHGHRLSVGLNTVVDDAEVPNAKDQDPARHDEEV